MNLPFESTTEAIRIHRFNEFNAES